MPTSPRWSIDGGDVPVVRWHAGDGIVAAVSTRAGGVSPPPFDTLNLGRSSGDTDAHVDENRRRFLRALGIPDARLALLHQVHGDRILGVGAAWSEAPPRPQADGLVTRETGRVLTVTVADCAPVFVVHPRSGALALVHAGWRGTAARIAALAVARLEEDTGAAAADFRAAVGPSIGPCCYEVGPEVTAALPEAVVPRPGSARPHLDLWRANLDQLAGAGVPREAVDVAGLCTACRGDVFFSYRRDGARSGRMLAVLGREASVTRPPVPSLPSEA